MTINCPKCKTKMLLRNGQYGEFFFCPNNKVCGAKVIGKKQAIASGMLKRGVHTPQPTPQPTAHHTTPSDAHTSKVRAVLSGMYANTHKAPPMVSIYDSRAFPYNVPPYLIGTVREHLEWLIEQYVDDVKGLQFN